jgi:hypothetical protein
MLLRYLTPAAASPESTCTGSSRCAYSPVWSPHRVSPSHNPGMRGMLNGEIARDALREHKGVKVAGPARAPPSQPPAGAVAHKRFLQAPLCSIIPPQIKCIIIPSLYTMLPSLPSHMRAPLTPSTRVSFTITQALRWTSPQVAVVGVSALHRWQAFRRFESQQHSEEVWHIPEMHPSPAL